MWTRQLMDISCIKYPPFVTDIGIHLSPYQSYTFVYRANRAGDLTLNVGWGTFTKLFVATNNSFNPDTGEPTSYISSTEDNSITVSTQKDGVYYFTVKGKTNEANNCDVRMYVAIVDYIRTMQEPRTDYSNTEYIYFNVPYGFQSLVYPITFSIPCTFYFYGQMIVNGAVTTSLKDINKSNGLPTSGDISQPTGLEAVGYKGRKFTASANTTYYIYITVDWRNEYLTRSDRKVRFVTSPTNPIESEGITGSRRKYQVYDQYDQQQGSMVVSGLIPTNGIYPQDWHGYTPYRYSSYSDYNRYTGVGQPVQVMWDSSDVSLTDPYGTTYKWCKFVGWFSDRQFEHLVSTDINLIYKIPTEDATLYGYCYLTDEDFNWREPIASGKPFKIAAEEWNEFICYCNGRICSQGGFGITPDSYHLPNDRPEAYKYWSVKSELDNYSTSPLVPTDEVVSGDYIRAEYYQNILQEARSI